MAQHQKKKGAKSAATKAGPKVKSGQKSGGASLPNHNLALVRAAKGGKKAGPKVKSGQKSGGLSHRNHNLALIRA
jgi:hypothetical protein